MLILLLVAAAVGTFASLEESRIVGGNKVPPDFLPSISFMAGFDIPDKDGNTDRCGGTLITPRHILTAAHCFDESSRPIGTNVYINSLTLSGKGFPNKTAVIAKVTAVKIHELYKVLTIPYKPKPGQLPNEYDIAIMTLDRNVTTVKPVHLANCTRSTAIEGKSAGLVTGWGRTGPNNSYPDSNWLLGTVLNIVNTTECQRTQPKLAPSIKRNQICANYAPGGRDVCVGDSGGPLLFGSQKDGFIQVGLVSYGPSKCGEKKQSAGVYTRVCRFNDWISTNTGGLIGSVQF